MRSPMTGRANLISRSRSRALPDRTILTNRQPIRSRGHSRKSERQIDERPNGSRLGAGRIRSLQIIPLGGILEMGSLFGRPLPPADSSRGLILWSTRGARLRCRRSRRAGQGRAGRCRCDVKATKDLELCHLPDIALGGGGNQGLDCRATIYSVETADADKVDQNRAISDRALARAGLPVLRSGAGPIVCIRGRHACRHA